MPRARASEERREREKEARRRRRQALYLVAPVAGEYLRRSVLTGPLTTARRYGVQNQPGLFDQRLLCGSDREFHVPSLLNIAEPVVVEEVAVVQPEDTNEAAESEEDVLQMVGTEFDELIEEVSTDVKLIVLII